MTRNDPHDTGSWSVLDLVRAVLGTVRDTDLTFLAAAVAYYAFISLVPLLVLALLVATALGGDAFADRLVGTMAATLVPEARAPIRDAITASAGRGSAGLLGTVLLFWGALRGVRGLDRAFEAVYGGDAATAVLGSIREAVTVLVCLGIAAAAIGIVATWVGSVLGGVVSAGAPVLLFPALVAVFLPLYVVLPAPKTSLRAALPGAAVAAGGWVLLGAGFSLYATTIGGRSVYGVLGGVLLLLTWLYLGALSLGVGAATNAVLAGYRDATGWLVSPGTTETGSYNPFDGVEAGEE